MNKMKLVALSIMATGALAGTNAYAGDIAKFLAPVPILGEAARQVDNWNRQNGRPIHAWGAATANVFVPGSGVVLGTLWASRAGPNPAPAQQMGNRCLTDAGISEPGRPNAVGTPCWMPTPWGPAHGHVVQ